MRRTLALDTLIQVYRGFPISYNTTGFNTVFTAMFGIPLLQTPEFKAQCRERGGRSATVQVLEKITKRIYKLLGKQPFGFIVGCEVKYYKSQELYEKRCVLRLVSRIGWKTELARSWNEWTSTWHTSKKISMSESES